MPRAKQMNDSIVLSGVCEDFRSLSNIGFLCLENILNHPLHNFKVALPTSHPNLQILFVVIISMLIRLRVNCVLKDQSKSLLTRLNLNNGPI
jgi:hypothetical protein